MQQTTDWLTADKREREFSLVFWWKSYTPAAGTPNKITTSASRSTIPLFRGAEMSHENSVNPQAAELLRPSFQSVCEDVRDGQKDADSAEFIKG